MTNKEALAIVAQISLSDAAIDKAFIDATGYSITANADYVSGNAEAVDFIAMNLLINFLAADVSEGGYSISYKNSIREKIVAISEKWGFEIAGGPTCQDISFMW